MEIDLRHSGEGAALDAVASNKIIGSALKVFQTVYTELTDFARIPMHSFRVTHTTHPKLYRLIRVAAERLDMDREIPVYAEGGYDLTAKTVGTDDDCIITINSAALRMLDDEELIVLIGREMGHIKYRHVTYMNMHEIIGKVVAMIPGIGSIAAPMIEAAKGLLLNWMRCASYTADRAGAVAAANAEAVIRCISKGMGACTKNELVNFTYKNLDSREYETKENLSVVGQIVLQSLITSRPVQFGSFRITELKKWNESEECKNTFPRVYFSSEERFGLNKLQKDLASFMYVRAITDYYNTPLLSIALMHAAAKRGEARAMSWLGNMYMQGKGELARDVYEGLSYLREAALKGDANALYNLGIMLMHDISELQGYIKTDKPLGMRMIAASARKGNEKAVRYIEQNGYRREKLSAEIFRRAGYGALDGDFAELQSLMIIPADELIYALDTEKRGEELVYMCAVCDTGVYSYSGYGLPSFASWRDIASQDIEARRKHGRIELINGKKLVCSTAEKDMQGSVVQAVSLIYNTIKNK